ncbi:MliC family protein [Enterovibrio coralii]|uniref:C-type lysozyme inhibitor domain-containing protein n=1 Tax=Enterovibrio coralii TaxID=294935 RepID=A0A135I2D4_9GAMM|nr:MliC family protein [Enterovibrio coralii]KXF79613.1 hypothetical protein ATN88_15070 [Enterovibrio coralii]
MKTTVISLVSIMLLAGCSSKLPSQYVCEDGQSFQALITSDTALIRLNDEDKELPRIRSASGVQYQSDGGNTGFYGKGKEAMLVWGM